MTDLRYPVDVWTGLDIAAILMIAGSVVLFTCIIVYVLLAHEFE